MKLPLNNYKQWLLYLGLAFGYLISGLLLSNISSQSQVVAIWAPSSFALVGCYLWWWRFFPAVFIASAIFSFHTQPNVELLSLAGELGIEISLIAFGATLQAAIGSFILHRWLGNPLSMRSDSGAIGFIVIVGVLVNLISPNIGVLALSLFNESYSTQNHWSNVVYWWLGDSLGVIIVTPFLLSIINLNNNEPLKAQLMIISAAALLFCSVTLTTLVFSQNSYQNAQQLAKRELKVVENGLYRQLNSSLNQIQILASFIQINPHVTRTEFDDFVTELMQDQPNIKAMSWNPKIPNSESESFIALMEKIYQRPINIKGKPLEPDDPLVVVKLISPQKENEAAIGFNIYSNPKRKSVLMDKHLPYQPIATPIIQLVQSEVAEPAYLLFMPVYQQETSGQRLLGYATGVFLAQQMLEHAMGLAHKEIFLYEIYENNKSTVFAGNTKNQQQVLSGNQNALSLTFNLAGQIWHMNLAPNREFLTHYQSRLALMLYILQLVLVGFIMLLILLMNNRHIVLNHKVQSRTEELEQAKQQSDRASKAKSRFLANMSHEIRTPLNAVIGFSQLAKQIDDKPTLDTYIDKIELSSSNLLNIVNDILDISKIESQKLELEHIHFDLRLILKRLEVMFESEAQSKKLKWQIEQHLPRNINYLGDPVRIEQILINLVGNAFKFTSKGEVSVCVNVQSQSQECHIVHFVVKDSGIGIDDKVQKNLFDPFIQADSSTSRRFGGTGLGLTISRELSQLMGGDISVQSYPDKGSKFNLTLELEPTLQKLDQKTDIPHKNFTHLNVLVAEDNSINQMVIDELLKSIGINATIVSNGAETLDIIRQQNFDVILMDCQMPIMDGYEATKQIRKLPQFQHLPIIALTADVMPQDKQLAFEVGFTSHIGKPIDIKQLCEVLSQY
jgi:signal transduction histidine kinase/CheY-like chemotaxis protein/integral membrane sensor domain MASE1